MSQNSGLCLFICILYQCRKLTIPQLVPIVRNLKLITWYIALWRDIRFSFVLHFQLPSYVVRKIRHGILNIICIDRATDYG